MALERFGAALLTPGALALPGAELFDPSAR